MSEAILFLLFVVLLAAILVPATAVVIEDWWDGATAFVPRVPAMLLVDVLAVCLVVDSWWPLLLVAGVVVFVALVLLGVFVGQELRRIAEREGGAW